jgi:hypothetical protein
VLLLALSGWHYVAEFCQRNGGNNWKIKCLDMLIDVLVCELVRSCFENSFEFQYDNDNTR